MFEDLRKFQGCVKGINKKFKGCFKEKFRSVSKKFPGSFKGVRLKGVSMEF